MRRGKLSKGILSAYSFIIYFILYAPIIILVIFSFNKSKLNAVWQGFTLNWYSVLAGDGDVILALQHSLTIAVISTILSTVIGTLAAVGMYKYKFKGKTVLDGLLYVPIIIPEIVMGISLLVFFTQTKITLGLLTLVLAHVTFSVSYVVIVVRARMKNFDRSLEEAAMDLGANGIQTFTKVTLPVIMPGIVAGALMAFTLSLDDVIISFFVSGAGYETLPLRIYSMVKIGVSPEINALSTVMLAITLSIAVISELMQLKKSKKN
ncbi:ABC-type spermidine/putrescine transport system, permease component II [Clostridium acidisoli DSM 12555]|uniref:ABC-type spermidine/putrescine transport system, permease component II n=1 Tax=Clostridium acidisoli DSM 12555 TaxID=1121291 RepID=A0A1W1XHK7_9CLOT|nr:ABC transporter permease subunit [Clostridium acidisoli]SMC23264.1 ABC-type spermidine/putrescine transport system, permease component II [Clostridium acidisoli DSM 12555]